MRGFQFPEWTSDSPSPPSEPEPPPELRASPLADVALVLVLIDEVLARNYNLLELICGKTKLIFSPVVYGHGDLLMLLLLLHDCQKPQLLQLAEGAVECADIQAIGAIQRVVVGGGR